MRRSTQNIEQNDQNLQQALQRSAQDGRDQDDQNLQEALRRSTQDPGQQAVVPGNNNQQKEPVDKFLQEELQRLAQKNSDAQQQQIKCLNQGQSAASLSTNKRQRKQQQTTPEQRKVQLARNSQQETLQKEAEERAQRVQQEAHQAQLEAQRIEQRRAQLQRAAEQKRQSAAAPQQAQSSNSSSSSSRSQLSQLLQQNREALSQQQNVQAQLQQGSRLLVIQGAPVIKVGRHMHSPVRPQNFNRSVNALEQGRLAQWSRDIAQQAQTHPAPDEQAWKAINSIVHAYNHPSANKDRLRTIIRPTIQGLADKESEDYQALPNELKN